MNYEVEARTEPDQDMDLKIDATDVVYIPVPVPQNVSHKALRDRDKPKQHPISAIDGLSDALAGKVDAENGKSLMSDAEHTKLSGIQAGAQVNVIESVKVNGEPLAINGKAVDVKVPTVYATDLQYDATKGIIKLIGADGSVIGSIDTNLERVIKSGRYDTAKQELVFVTDDGSEIRVPVGDLVDTYTGDGTTITVQDNVFSVAKAVMDQITAKADDADVVHKAGAEDIVGIKTFRNRVDGEKSISLGMYSTYLVESQDTRLANRNQNPATDVENMIIGLADSTHFGYCSFSTRQKSNGSRDVGISLYTPSGWQEAGVKYDSESKNVFGFAPSTPSGSNGTEIVTAGYLNTASTVVHTTGNETMAGNKDFTGKVTAPAPSADANGHEIVTAGWANGKYVAKAGDVMTGNLTMRFGSPEIQVQNTDVSKRGDIPTERKVSSFRITDASQGTLLDLNNAVYTDGSSLVTLSCIANLAKRQDNAIKLGWGADGIAFTEVISPQVNSNSRNIATTEWVRTCDGLVQTTGNQTIAGDKKFTSGYVGLKSNYDSAILPKTDPVYGGIQFFDKNDVNTSMLLHRAYKSGITSIGLTLKMPAETGYMRGDLLLWSGKDGTAWSTSPWRTSGWSDKDIVTYGMLKTLGLIKG